MKAKIQEKPLVQTTIGECKVCGKPLIERRPQTITCSSACRTAASRQQRKEMAEKAKRKPLGRAPGRKGRAA